MAAEVLGVDTDVTCSDGINRAYVVNDVDLKRFFETGRNWVEEHGVGSSVIRCKALLKKTKEALVSDRINTILGYSNPRDTEICGISLEMASKKEGRTFQIDFQSFEYPNLMQVTVGGEHLPETQKLFNRVLAEAKEITQWYWWIACRRWLLKLASWLFWIFFVLLFSYMALIMVGAAYRDYRVRKEYERLAKKIAIVRVEPTKAANGVKKPPLREKTRLAERHDVEPGRAIWQFISDKRFWGGAAIVVGGVFLERLIFYLFPKFVFEVGKGKERHKRLKARRKWIGRILTTIIVLGVIVPIISKIVTSWL